MASAKQLLGRFRAIQEREPRLRERIASGDPEAVKQLATLLARRGEIVKARELLTAAADGGDDSAGRQLDDLLAEQGHLDALRGRAAAGDLHAARRLADGLTDRGELAEAIAVTRRLVDAGDEEAHGRLDDLLARKGDLHGLREHVDSGDGYAALLLADLYVDRGQRDIAIALLRDFAHGKSAPVAVYLARRLHTYGCIDDAIDVLRPRADAVLYGYDGPQESADWGAADLLDKLLAERGDTSALEERGRVGDDFAERELAAVLTQRGDIPALWVHVKQKHIRGRNYAEQALVNLLAERGDIDGLRAAAADDIGHANTVLDDWLAEHHADRVPRPRSHRRDGSGRRDRRHEALTTAPGADLPG